MPNGNPKKNGKKNDTKPADPLAGLTAAQKRVLLNRLAAEEGVPLAVDEEEDEPAPIKAGRKTFTRSRVEEEHEDDEEEDDAEVPSIETVFPRLIAHADKHSKHARDAMGSLRRDNLRTAIYTLAEATGFKVGGGSIKTFGAGNHYNPSMRAAFGDFRKTDDGSNWTAAEAALLDELRTRYPPLKGGAGKTRGSAGGKKDNPVL